MRNHPGQRTRRERAAAEAKNENLVAILIDMRNLCVTVFYLLAQTNTAGPLHHLEDNVPVSSHAVVVERHLVGRDRE